MSIYKKVFGDSLKAVWRNPILWFIGIFAVFFGGSVELELFDSFFSQNKNIFYDTGSASLGTIFNGGVLSRLPETITANFGTFFKFTGIALALVIIIAVVVVLAVFTQLIIIDKVYRVRKITDSRDTTKRSLKQLISAHIADLWPITGMNAVYKIILMILLYLIGLPVLLTVNNPTIWADIGYIGLFMIFMPLAIVLAMVMRFATVYKSLKKMDLRTSISSAWNLFKNNWLLTIEMSFILFLITIISSFLILLIIYSLAIPMSFVSLLPAMPARGILVMYGLFLLCAFVIFALGAAMISSFNIAVWTNLFAEIEKTGGESKISRLFNKLTNR